MLQCLNRLILCQEHIMHSFVKVKEFKHFCVFLHQQQKLLMPSSQNLSVINHSFQTGYKNK